MGVHRGLDGSVLCIGVTQVAMGSCLLLPPDPSSESRAPCSPAPCPPLTLGAAGALPAWAAEAGAVGGVAGGAIGAGAAQGAAFAIAASGTGCGDRNELCFSSGLKDQAGSSLEFWGCSLTALAAGAAVPRGTSAGSVLGRAGGSVAAGAGHEAAPAPGALGTALLALQPCGDSEG